MDRYTDIRAACIKDLGVDPEVPITSDMTGQDVARVALARSLLKKREVWTDTAVIELQEQRALELFCESNSACAAWSWRPDHVFDDVFAGELKSFLADLLDPCEPEEAFDFGKFAELMGPGPGAARGANSDNFYTKLFESPLTATSEYLFTLYRAATCERPYWAEAEEYRHRRYGFQVVSGSSYFSVPKNEEIQRACATEASINMMGQKALGKWTEQRLDKRWGLSLKRQPRLNRLLALIGSVTGRVGTVDLKSASDRNAMAMVDEFFPARFVRWVRLFRSPTCRLPDGSELEMAMCSSMGNGFTFPLQTALFVGVVAVCYKLLGIPFKRIAPRRTQGVTRRVWDPVMGRQDCDLAAGNWGVFGDDIIVCREAYDYVCRQLTKLGHVVNENKSFNSGGFRESCGSDYFHGYDVRGVYIKSLETPLDVYSAINRLTRWSARHGVNLSHTLSLLLGWVKFLPVPVGAADHEGVKVPFDETREIPLRRGDAKVAREARNWQSSIYRGCVVKPSQKRVTALLGGDEIPPSSTSDLDCYSFGNQAGWAVTALGGYVGTPPYEVVEPSYDHNSEVGPAFASKGRMPDHSIGLREKGDRPLRWKVKACVGHWPKTQYLAGPICGTDLGDAWEHVAGNLEFLKLLPRE